MKTTKEDISDNYTTLQYLQTLDMFIWRAIEPIAQSCPSFFLNYLCKVVARQTLKASAKFTSDERSKLPIKLFNTLVAKPEKRIEHAKTLYLNRGLLFGLISVFRNHLKYFKFLNTRSKLSGTLRTTVIHRVYQSLDVDYNTPLYAALQECEHWDKKARDFKAKIVQKYTRLALMQAKSTYKDYNHYLRLSDVVQIYLNTVARAIDRCDARQGVLTSFIQNWFKSAKGEVAKLCEGQQDQSYEALTEDHGDAAHNIIGITEPDSLDVELRQQLAFVAKRVDKQGLVKTSLGIPEYVTAHQRARLLRFALDKE